MTLVVTDAQQAILPPSVGTRAGMVMRKVVPAADKEKGRNNSVMKFQGKLGTLLTRRALHCTSTHNYCSINYDSTPHSLIVYSMWKPTGGFRPGVQPPVECLSKVWQGGTFRFPRQLLRRCRARCFVWKKVLHFIRIFSLGLSSYFLNERRKHVNYCNNRSTGKVDRAL